MKRKAINIITITFFLIVNTTYFWEAKLGLFAFPTTLLLLIVFLGLTIILIGQLFSVINEKLKDKSRLLTVGLISTVLTLTFLYPNGLWNFNDSQEDSLLIATREGSANCRTTLLLQKNNKFKERNVCFGVTEINGNYEFRNDTIFFSDIELGRNESEYYEFAVIKLSEINIDKKTFDLVRFKNHDDTTGHILWINKNELMISE